MFTNPKSIIILLFCLVAGIGYYAWQQKKQALSELAYLKSSGVNIDFSLRTRPIIAVGKKKKAIYLLSGKGKDTIQKLSFIQIKQIKFIEAPVNNQDDSSVNRRDTIDIILTDGKRIRIGDLRKTAQQSKMIFEEHHVLNGKLSIHLRR